MSEPGAVPRVEAASGVAPVVTSEDSSSGPAAARMALARRWLADFPVNPHPDLGRSGPVCPYMGRAHDLGRVELFEFDARAGDEALVSRARQLRSEVEERGAVDETDHTYLVFFLVPYGLPEADLKAMLQRVHVRLRPEFVQRGLLAGDFWPEHRTRGLHSQSFRPFESPIPLFAVRNMIPGDLPFFAAPATPPRERLTYLGYYRAHFASSLPVYWRRRLAEAERAATAALGGVES